MDDPTRATRLFQIGEPDLATLEADVPLLCELLWTPDLNNATRARMRRVQQILSSIRWGGGPPGEVIIIPADGPIPSEDNNHG